MINNHARGASPGSWPRLVLTTVIAGAILTPGLQGQEQETTTSAAADGGLFKVAVGARIEYYGLLSPGASFQMTWDTPGQRASWLGGQLHAQVIRFEVDPQVPNADIVRRDYHLAARFKAGFGRGDGPVFYGFAEAGAGIIGNQPEAKRGDLYLLSGVGAGVGLTLLPVTFAIEGTMGRADRPSSDLFDSFVMTLVYHLP